LLKISDGHSSPVVLLNDGSDEDRLYIVERSGIVKIMDDLSSGSVLATPFLDISGMVSSGGERGLLGMTFHPDYPANPTFFVNYTFNDAGQLTTKIARYTVTADPNVADPSSEEVIIQVEQPFSNHNAGDIKFGPDGYLYITLGDGGSGGDPDNYSQNPLELLGSILRLDISGDDFPGDNLRNYAIPNSMADPNPFIGVSTHLDEIWSFGWRNPWRFSFDSGTGDMWVADVGQTSREEISFEAAGDPGGGNYGWSCEEGFLVVDFNPCFPGPLVDPIYDMPRSDAQSITGGYVYRGSAFPNMQGFYFTADYASGQWWRINSTDFTDVTQTGEVFSVTTFGTSVNDELYCATIGGDIYRIMDGSVCPDQLTITDHPEDVYSSQQEINSTATVTANRDITYNSPEINLESNFEVEPTGSLTAQAITCLEYIQQTQY